MVIRRLRTVIDSLKASISLFFFFFSISQGWSRDGTPMTMGQFPVKGQKQGIAIAFDSNGLRRRPGGIDKVLRNNIEKIGEGRVGDNVSL
jgi:hypothetical protein